MAILTEQALSGPHNLLKFKGQRLKTKEQMQFSLPMSADREILILRWSRSSLCFSTYSASAHLMGTVSRPKELQEYKSSEIDFGFLNEHRFWVLILESVLLSTFL